eukprot:CAMPEP_0196658326 /NCGR_PEP_ID=MMETSP1086-20130531/29080_1 /TAXON_ID=77921 /ORGANISM="Cyanoptyche  gloeocystis , Strain SAG4.97" /LENGTH=45 /DNA_ID= /DNA_START= /DNA_END= /DNA_ORIENTATION=
MVDWRCIRGNDMTASTVGMMMPATTESTAGHAAKGVAAQQAGRAS